MNCFRHENSDQSDLFFQSKNVKLFDIPLLPTKPAENSHFWQIKVEADFKVHILIFGWNLGTCVRIWKCVRFCRAIWFHPHHRHLVCCVHLANPMCTGIDVLCQGDWCPLPPQPAAALASSSSSSCPNLSFCSARSSVVMIRRVYRGHNLFWLCTAQCVHWAVFFSFRPRAVGHIVQPRDRHIIEHIWKYTLEKSRTNATSVSLAAMIQVLWGLIWNYTEEKSQTNATSATTFPLKQSIWGHI